MAADFAYDVFLSHSSKDKPVARKLAQRLKAEGIRVWLDEWEIQPGDIIGLKVEQGLQNSRVLVLIMSSHALGSEWVTLERHTALFRDPSNIHRRFVPMLIPPLDDEDDMRRVLDLLDGMLFIGGADLDCRNDGYMPRPSMRLLDARRERFDRRLM
jgi:hypothetical protein